jgi:polar amino acid transport system substrate-binding protein
VKRIRLVTVAPALLALLAVAACSGGETAEQTTAAAPSASAAPLFSELPDKYQDSGVLQSAYTGQYPPFVTYDTDNTTLIGAGEDLRAALEAQLGVTIETTMLDSIPTLLTGVQGGRYDTSMGPVGDTPDKRETVDFIDYVNSRGAFVVAKGNPLDITSLEDVCGHTVAAVSGGSAENKLQDFAAECAGKGEPEATLQSFEDQNTMVLAVQSGRADAAYSGLAVLSYYQQQFTGDLDLVPEPTDVGLGVVPQGMIVLKGDPLGPVLLKAMQAIFDDGTYASVMEKWHLTDLMLPAPAMNLAD